MRTTVKSNRELREYRRQSLLLAPKALGVKIKKACEFFKYSVSSYYRIKREDQAQEQKGPWGGRRRAYMSYEEERGLALRLGKMSESGGFVDIGHIRGMLEKKVGKTLHKTTIYRFLDRHGFRKVAPRRYHPQSNKEAQEEFKKTLQLI